MSWLRKDWVRRLLEAVIDTNVLVYDTFIDSLYHEEAASLLDNLDSWIIPLIVLYEYAWFLKGFTLEAGKVREKVLDYASDVKTVVACENVEDILWALNVVVGEGLSVARFNDMVVLAVAARRGVPLATFDTRLRRRAEERGIEVLPELKRVSGD